MTGVDQHGPTLVFHGDGVRLLAQLLRTVDTFRRRNGLPKSSELSGLEQQVTDAICAQRTLNRHSDEWDRQQWVTPKRYAELTGCTERTARRHAALHGRKVGGRWTIPLER